MRVSSFIVTPSLASIAWWSPSLQRRPGCMRPVNSSTMSISPTFRTYSLSLWKSALARTAVSKWWANLTPPSV